MNEEIKYLKGLFNKALKKVDPYNIIKNNIYLENNFLNIINPDSKLKEKVRFDLSNFNNLIIIGLGKASFTMAKAIEEILKDRITDGAIVTKYGHGGKLKFIKVFEAGHPIPDKNSMEAARFIVNIVKKYRDEKTLIINLISGGGSALFTLPYENLSLEDFQTITNLLLESGANINEINCIRKHLSSVKGGRFATLTYPSTTLNLILSDVIGDRLDAIASGIAVPDNTTFQEALNILKKYDLMDKFPEKAYKIIVKGSNGELTETPKPGDKVFDKIRNILLGNNAIACKEIKEIGTKDGYNTAILSTHITGDTDTVASLFCGIAVDVKKGISVFKKPIIIVGGGETTVVIKGKGKGGRNQQMVLSFLLTLKKFLSIDEMKGIYFLSGGTDGTDGPTDAAGAVFDYKIYESIQRKPEEYLKRNDSYNFFKNTSYHLITGPTGTNVCDLYILMVK